MTNDELLEAISTQLVDWNRESISAQDAIEAIKALWEDVKGPLGLGYGFCETCGTAIDISFEIEEFCPKCNPELDFEVWQDQ